MFKELLLFYILCVGIGFASDTSDEEDNQIRRCFSGYLRSDNLSFDQGCKDFDSSEDSSDEDLFSIDLRHMEQPTFAPPQRRPGTPIGFSNVVVTKTRSASSIPESVRTQILEEDDCRVKAQKRRMELDLSIERRRTSEDSFTLSPVTQRRR